MQSIKRVSIINTIVLFQKQFPLFVKTKVGIVSYPSSDTLDAETKSEERRRAWENGEIDYTGRDRFDNIMDKLNESMGCNPSYNVKMPL